MSLIKNIKTKISKELNLVNTIISIVAVFIAVVALIGECHQRNETDKLNLSKLSEDYRPNLVVSKIRVNSVKFDVDTLALSKRSTLLGTGLKEEGGSLLPIDTKVNLDIMIKNDGVSQAKFVGYLFADSLCNNKLDLERFRQVMHVEPQKSVIEEKDSTHINFDMALLNIYRNRTTIHLLLLYENDFGFLYDTYCWIHYVIKYPNAIIRKKLWRKNTVTLNGPLYLKFINLNQRSYIYSTKDTTRVLKYTNSLN